MKVSLEPYNPGSPQKFWCGTCDSTVVDSTDHSTGRYFIAAGHAFSQRTREYDGSYEAVMFAVCNYCLERA